MTVRPRRPTRSAPTNPNGVPVGYARVSTAEQHAGLGAQLRDLKAAGCSKTFSERVSSAAKREALEAAIDYVREGDTMVVTRPDRLARSVADLLDIVGRLKAKSVGLRVLSLGGSDLDTRTPTGRLMLTMLDAVAEFERALMLERQREGIAKAKAEGRYRGRAPTVMRQAAEIHRLKADGVRPTEIARRLGIARSGVYRALGTAAGQAKERPGSTAPTTGDT